MDHLRSSRRERLDQPRLGRGAQVGFARVGVDREGVAQRPAQEHPVEPGVLERIRDQACCTATGGQLARNVATLLVHDAPHPGARGCLVALAGQQRGRRGAAPQHLDRLVEQGQVGAAHRKVGADRIEPGGEQQGVRRLDERRVRRIEREQHARAGPGAECPNGLKAGARERLARARREAGEHRVPGGGAHQAPRGPGGRALGRAERAGAELVERGAIPEAGVGVVAEHHEQPAAAAVEIEHRLELGGPQRLDVVDHDDIGLGQARGQRGAVHRLDRQARGGRAGFEGEPQRRGWSVLAHQHPQGARASGREHAPVVERQRIVGNCDHAALLGQARERQQGRAFAALGQVQEPAPELVAGLGVACLDREVPGARAEAGGAHRERGAALGGGERGVGEADVGAAARRERNQVGTRLRPRAARHAHGGGSPRAREARGLEVGDPEQLAVERMRFGQRPRRELERHGVVGGAGARYQRLDRAAQPSQIAAGSRGHRMDRLIVGHQQQLVLGAQGREQVLDHALRRGHQGPTRGPGRPHAAALIHQGHDAGGGTPMRAHAAAQRRARDRERQGGDRQGAQQQQQPLAQLEPANLALVDLGEELERGEAHLARAPPREQVDDDGDRGGRETDQKQRVEKAHRGRST